MKWWLWSHRRRISFPVEDGEAETISEALEAANKAAAEHIRKEQSHFRIVVTDNGRPICEVSAQMRIPSTRR